VARLASPYLPRRPTDTVLYRAVREHLETFLSHTRETYAAPLPRYVEQELRSYLRCGVFSHGFVRLRCDACGHDLLVAYSCKGRGICPSCAGRRMANCASHLVDRVVPGVPVRQYVLSLPYELRRLAAFKQDVLGAFVRIFIQAVSTHYRARSPIKGVEIGAITFLQRFGGSLNLNLHLHVAFLDGVFARDAQGRVAFHPAPAPNAVELEDIVRRAHRRATAWLRRRGYVDERPLEARSNEASEQDALDACAAIAMQRGTFAKLAAKDDSRDDGANADPTKLRFSAEHEGFNLHAGVHIAAGDDAGRERLFRYGARPPLALDRLRRLPDGRFAYRVKYARAGRAKHRIMAPLELLARIAAILPPPRFPLTRLHGVLAPRSSWRKDVVPRPREAMPSTERKKEKACDRTTHPGAGAGAGVGVRAGDRRAASTAGLDLKRAPTSPPTPRKPERADDASQRTTVGRVTSRHSLGALAPILLTPSILAVAHWDRLMGGLLYAASPYLPWAPLLRRTFAVDVMACPNCHSRLRVIQTITEPSVANAILERLGLPTDAPIAARARDPTDRDGEESYDDGAA
jgi:hypothetical protein